ncbi:isoprenylcysteine carboxylmethyltransferase family protein [Sphingomonas sp. CFBP8993]|uniref:isoprenylcysteine carboxyl methyltransferase family protein n=1 Tax=Sphingomonas sp. CFBP8993 TaxID=3096526 RepID=UPI002A6B5619|nr:isoprenylcysteine carboxylmethyltransferase family protein [Sphingomonas sp. CFBP8993]MDY0959097.1 isoprenylcysteine carboxylmethyltransferase family protein [Sphingomonas sp. CFBP8993]
MILPYAIMAFVTLQRLSELVIAKRNTARLMAAGAREYGANHYPVMVAMHTAWLLALWFSVGDRPISWPLLLVFVVLQGMRIWVLATLGPRWTTRIIVLPGVSLVAKGPFRFLRHPNYAVVTAEIAVLPLTFGLVGIAALFTILNAAMLYVRIGAENRALGLNAGATPPHARP